MAMERQPESSQLSLLLTDVGERKYDPRFDDFRIVYPSNQETAMSPSAALAQPSEGISLPLKKYYENRKKMLRAVSAANSRYGFSAYTDTKEGFEAARERYGADIAIVKDGAERNANDLQRTMDELFLVDELIAAGFVAEAIRRASRENTRDMNHAFGGPHNELKRAQEYRYLNRKIDQLSDQ